MNLAGVMDEVAGRLETLPGLRVFAWPPGTASPPAAIVGYPTEHVFDETYGNGMETITLPVVVVVGRATDRTARDTLSGYVSTGGVKRTLETGPGETWDTIVVSSPEYDYYDLGSVSHIAVIFDVTVTGKG